MDHGNCPDLTSSAVALGARRSTSTRELLLAPITRELEEVLAAWRTPSPLGLNCVKMVVSTLPNKSKKGILYLSLHGVAMFGYMYTTGQTFTRFTSHSSCLDKVKRHVEQTSSISKCQLNPNQKYSLAPNSPPLPTRTDATRPKNTSREGRWRKTTTEPLITQQPRSPPLFGSAPIRKRGPSPSLSLRS